MTRRQIAILLALLKSRLDSCGGGDCRIFYDELIQLRSTLLKEGTEKKIESYDLDCATKDLEHAFPGKPRKES